MTEPQVYQVIYDETLEQKLQPVRDAVARCGRDLLAAVGPSCHRTAITATLAALREQGEQAVFDHLRGKLTP